jgi:hypothetical protein
LCREYSVRSPPSAPVIFTLLRTAPWPVGTSIATFGWDPAMCSPISRSSILAASYFCSAARTPGHAAAHRGADKRRDYYTDHAGPGYAFRAISIKTLGRFSPGAMQFLCRATHAAFPQPLHQRAPCSANVYRQQSVVQCRYLSRMLTAATGFHTAHMGSGWIRGEPQATPKIPN